MKRKRGITLKTDFQNRSIQRKTLNVWPMLVFEASWFLLRSFESFECFCCWKIPLIIFFTRIAKTKTIELHSTWSSSAVECMGRLKNIERERENVCLCVCGVRECVCGEMEGGLLLYWGKSVCEKDLSATLEYQRVRVCAWVRWQMETVHEGEEAREWEWESNKA